MTADTRAIVDELHKAYREGDRAAALIRTSFVQRSTGRTMNMHFATFMRFADGRVIEFREFSDTFDVVQQALGASLHVPAIAV
jgi:ketosteroid isomerase-like protein